MYITDINFQYLILKIKTLSEIKLKLKIISLKVKQKFVIKRANKVSYNKKQKFPFKKCNFMFYSFWLL